MCHKPNPWIIVLVNTVIVFIVFILVDLVYYGLIAPGPDPYTKDLGEKMIYTALFALVYGHLYNKASRIWRPNSGEAFVGRSYVTPEGAECKISFYKLYNSLVFSLLVSLVIILAVAIGAFTIQVILTDLLHGFRGHLPGGDSDTVVTTVQVVVAGATMELTGKTESDPDR